MLADGACFNCGCCDFVVDFEKGDRVCVECGCCDPGRLAVHTEGYKATHNAWGHRAQFVNVQETVPSGAYYENCLDAVAAERNRRSNSPPYRRETYWSERISQWRMREPDIDAADFARILAKWHDFTARFGGTPRFAGAVWTAVDRCSYVLDKEDCRELLWSIDEEITRDKVDTGQLTYAQKRIYEHQGIDVAAIGKPFFVKKYLVSLSHFFPFFTRFAARSLSKCTAVCSRTAA